MSAVNEASPRMARRLIEALLSAADAGAMTGDLDEEFTRFVLPERGLVRARAWYWRQVLLSLPSMVRGRRPGPGSGGWLGGDLRYAIRVLARRPGFTIATVLTLALGLGVNTTVFSVVNAVLVRPLPYENAERLVRPMPAELFFTDAEDAPLIDERMTTLDMFVPWGRSLFLFSNGGDAEEVRGARVGWRHFEMLGVQPLLGRAFVRADAEASDAIILSHGLWVRRFGADPTVVGRTIDVSGTAATVVGVMGPDYVPMEFDWEVWNTLPLDPELARGMGLAGNGRLAPGATIALAQEEAGRVFTEIWGGPGYVATAEQLASIQFVPLRQWLLGDARDVLLVVTGAVACLLLLACANVANLFLGQNGSRAREFAVRAALGGSRARVARQLLVEVTVLSLIGAAVGLVAAGVSMSWVTAHLPEDLPRAGSVGLTPGVVLSIGACALLVALLAGVIPAHQSTARSLGGLAGAGRGSSPGRRGLRFRSVLVGAEMAIAVVLVVGAGLMVRTVTALRSVDPGFIADNVVTMRMSPPSARYEAGPEMDAYYDLLTEQLARLPGVESVGGIQFLPMTPGGWWDEYVVEGSTPGAGEDLPSMAIRVVHGGYFETMRIPLLRGRTLLDGDGRREGEMVALINETLAREAFPAGDALGSTIGVDRGERPIRVVGVVGDVSQSDLRTGSHPELYLPFGSQPWRRMHMVIRTTGDATAAVESVAAVARAIDPQVTLTGPRLMTDVVAGTLGEAEMVTSVLGLFGLLGLGLGAVGVYGVAAQAVSERRREMGIRVALGAASSQVASRTVAQGMVPVVLGTAVGLGGALFGARLLQGLLYGVETSDLGTFLTAPSVLALVALASLAVPALRASSVDPVTTLREE